MVWNWPLFRLLCLTPFYLWFGLDTHLGFNQFMFVTALFLYIALTEVDKALNINLGINSKDIEGNRWDEWYENDKDIRDQIYIKSAKYGGPLEDLQMEIHKLNAPSKDSN